MKVAVEREETESRNVVSRQCSIIIYRRVKMVREEILRPLRHGYLVNLFTPCTASPHL